MAVSIPPRSAHIRFSTSLLARLGEELNPSIDQSILELVKNSYDADAKNCIVSLENITEIGGVVKIEDDGKGMNEEDIINGWLVLGASSKSVTKKTAGGRIPAGSKGLGRIAALRLGSKAHLESIESNNTKEKFSLTIDWSKFDAAKLVDDVSINIERTIEAKNRNAGTKISIKDLKKKIGVREIKRIARGLILLADPFDDDPSSFKPILISKEFKEMEALVSRRYFDEAEFHLIASIDNNGFAHAKVCDYLGNVLFEADHKTLTNGSINRYICPSVSFDLWAFILNASTFSTRSVSLSEIQEWLQEFGGVHLYENGLRVNPYGNAGNDWLDMNLSRTRSPEERPSTNNSIGVVRIKDSQGLLVQKTDRSGFIEDDMFFEIKSFCIVTLEWMARQRLNIAEKKRRIERERTAKESNTQRDNVETTISKLRSSSQKSKVKAAFDKYEKATQAQLKSLKSEVQLYRTLSTAGITAATFSHESNGNPIKAISLSIKTIDRRVKQYLSKKYDDLFSKPILNINRSLSSLSVLGNVTLKLLEHQKRRVVKVSIHILIKQVVDMFSPFLVGRDISVELSLAEGNPYLRASESAIESIITNLLNNSINALENSTKTRCIRISTIIQESTLLLIVADNGAGIKDIALRNIWLPGQTTSPNGTGLGLTIVRDAVFDLSGKVRAIANGEMGGAEFIIELPIIGV
jgi:signal transduction histidine kinase